MDYKFVQVMTILGFILCMVTAIGCINYLIMGWMGFSMIQGSLMQSLFGIAGVLMLIGTIMAFQKIESSL